MSTLQERVNLAFKKASLHKSSSNLESKFNKKEWLKQEWPELQKPEMLHLSEIKTTRKLTTDEVKTLSIY